MAFTVAILFGSGGVQLIAFADRPDLLVADFEGADCGSWKPTGEAFGPGPDRGAWPIKSIW